MPRGRVNDLDRATVGHASLVGAALYRQRRHGGITGLVASRRPALRCRVPNDTASNGVGSRRKSRRWRARGGMDAVTHSRFCGRRWRKRFGPDSVLVNKICRRCCLRISRPTGTHACTAAPAAADVAADVNNCCIHAGSQRRSYSKRTIVFLFSVIILYCAKWQPPVYTHKRNHTVLYNAAFTFCFINVNLQSFLALNVSSHSFEVIRGQGMKQGESLI